MVLTNKQNIYIFIYLRGGFRLWGIRILRICGDGVLPKVNLYPIDSNINIDQCN